MVPAFDDPERELLGRFRKNKDAQHLPAWWELYVHRLFVCLGYEVTVHPELPERSEKPDFLVTRGTESLYVEATTALNGDYKVNAQGQAIPSFVRLFAELISPGVALRNRKPFLNPVVELIGLRMRSNRPALAGCIPRPLAAWESAA